MELVMIRPIAVFHVQFVKRHVQEHAKDLMPYIVGSATGIQELVYDLLAYSRYVNHSESVSSGLQSMLNEGSYVD